MEYQLPTAIQNRLAQTGETPESFISHAIDTLVRKEMSQSFNDFPRHAVLDVEPLGFKRLLLLTFADGDRRLFSGEALKGCPLYEKISTDYGLTCARVEGYSVVFEDKYGIFDELPPEFLYENSVSLFDLEETVLEKLGLNEERIFLPDSFLKSCSAKKTEPAPKKSVHKKPAPKESAPKKASRRKSKKNKAPIVNEEFVPIE